MNLWIVSIKLSAIIALNVKWLSKIFLSANVLSVNWKLGDKNLKISLIAEEILFEAQVLYDRKKIQH